MKNSKLLIIMGVGVLLFVVAFGLYFGVKNSKNNESKENTTISETSTTIAKESSEKKTNEVTTKNNEATKENKTEIESTTKTEIETTTVEKTTEKSTENTVENTTERQTETEPNIPETEAPTEPEVPETPIPTKPITEPQTEKPTEPTTSKYWGNYVGLGYRTRYPEVAYNDDGSINVVNTVIGDDFKSNLEWLCKAFPEVNEAYEKCSVYSSGSNTDFSYNTEFNLCGYRDCRYLLFEFYYTEADRKNNSPFFVARWDENFNFY